MDSYILDTHALIWYIRGFSTISLKSKKIIQEIFEGNANCYISTMVVLEAFYVSLKHSDFIYSNFLKIIDKPNIKIVSFDKKVLNQSVELPEKMDIHDRIIVATAIITNTPLITKDKILRANFPNETIW